MGAALRWERGGETELEIGQAKRASPRAIAHLCIDMCSEGDFWTGLTMNLSETGLFVATHVILPPGSLVGLHLEIPRAARITTVGEVRWARRYTGDDDVPPGLGIAFVGLDVPSRSALRHFVTATRAASRSGG